MWPVICPASRYRMLQARLAEDPNQEHLAKLSGDQAEYWLDEAAMEEGSPNFAVSRGDALDLPAILYLQHPDDPIHPYENLESFIAGYRARGGAVDLHHFGGEAYDQIRAHPDSTEAKDAVAAIAAFVHARSGA